MADERVTHFLPPNTTTEIRIEEKEYTPIAPSGLQKILVGSDEKVIDPNTGGIRREVIKDSETGLNKARDAVEAHEVYDFNKQKRSCWFILDLETGSHGWFPGCIIRGTVIGPTDIKAAPDEASETLETISDAVVEVLEIDAIDQEPFIPGWYKVKYIQTGYIKENTVSNLRYEEPN